MSKRFFWILEFAELVAAIFTVSFFALSIWIMVVVISIWDMFIDNIINLCLQICLTLQTFHFYGLFLPFFLLAFTLCIDIDLSLCIHKCILLDMHGYKYETHFAIIYCKSIFQFVFRLSNGRQWQQYWQNISNMNRRTLFYQIILDGLLFQEIKELLK
mgnify:CR=1 FL=1